MVNSRVLAFAVCVLALCPKAAFSETPPPPTPDVVLQLSALDDALTIRQKAASYDQLIRSTRPQFTWRHHDMLWITHDAKGHVGFLMNRAYDIQLPRAAPSCYLLSAVGYAWPDRQEQAFMFTQAADTKPIVVTRDPRRGVVYQARWPSSPLMGSGSITDTRNIFLLCDGEHHWHLLGEGPVTSSGCNGASEYYHDSVEAYVQWTSDPMHPVDLAFTYLATEDWEIDGAGLNDPHHPSLTVRWDMAPSSEIERDGFPDGIDPRDCSPGCFKCTGAAFVIARKSESLAAFSARMAHCCKNAPADDDLRRSIFIRKLILDLRQEIPNLGGTVAVGQHITLPAGTVYRPDRRS